MDYHVILLAIGVATVLFTVALAVPPINKPANY